MLAHFAVLHNCLLALGSVTLLTRLAIQVYRCARAIAIFAVSGSIFFINNTFLYR